MQRMERKAYKYRFYPTEDQTRELARTFGCVRYVYNWALSLRTEAGLIATSVSTTPRRIGSWCG